MEERVKLSILLDLYGELLTEKQRDIMELYFNDDLSLTEIAENTNTSRQAAFDIVKRCEKNLYEYEIKLKLLEKSIKIDDVKNSIMDKLDRIMISIEDKESLNLIQSIRTDIRENI